MKKAMAWKLARQRALAKAEKTKPAQEPRKAKPLKSEPVNDDGGTTNESEDDRSS